MKISKEMMQEIADSNYEVNDYVFFQEDGSIIYVPEHERDNLVETDGNEVSFSKNTTVYNLSVFLDQTDITEPKTGDEYVFTLNALVDKIENIKHS
jgi:predicted mannosyl-3-phosphoglycerate phosphatase (HAD superfamily)